VVEHETGGFGGRLGGNARLGLQGGKAHGGSCGGPRNAAGRSF
jgi:hypothetical protein